MGPGPRFTHAARLAAAAKRRERSELNALNFNRPAVFALRADPPGMGYIWELRMFGGVSLRRGTEIHRTAGEAREAGRKALSSVTIDLPLAREPRLVETVD